MRGRESGRRIENRRGAGTGTKSEMAEVGPTHRASATYGEPQGKSNEAALAEEYSA
jgi:hypothetical protein